MQHLQMSDPVRFARMSTEELRSTFLLEDLFATGEVKLVYLDLDRAVVGAAVPGATPLSLPCPAELRADSFTERRELGVLNIGGPGSVQVGGEIFELAKTDALYIGKGAAQVAFSSRDVAHPAAFYLLSYPAHAAHPTTLARASDAESTLLGAPETANVRSIKRLIHLDGARSCQLVMGFTELSPGSVWNTMPAHTHMRRSEIYLYFDLREEDRVLHLMGPPQQTRHLIVANRQVAISPSWSIHAGAGTAAYSFCWGMGGENQVYTDMDPVKTSEML